MASLPVECAPYYTLSRWRPQLAPPWRKYHDRLATSRAMACCCATHQLGLQLLSFVCCPWLCFSCCFAFAFFCLVGHQCSKHYTTRANMHPRPRGSVLGCAYAPWAHSNFHGSVLRGNTCESKPGRGTVTAKSICPCKACRLRRCELLPLATPHGSEPHPFQYTCCAFVLSLCALIIAFHMLATCFL